MVNAWQVISHFLYPLVPWSDQLLIMVFLPSERRWDLWILPCTQPQPNMMKLICHLWVQDSWSGWRKVFAYINSHMNLVQIYTKKNTFTPKFCLLMEEGSIFLCGLTKWYSLTLGLKLCQMVIVVYQSNKGRHFMIMKAHSVISYMKL